MHNIRLAFFRIFHRTMLALVWLLGIFSKNYRKVYALYKRFYKKALDEL
jgi:hypothetical protein